MNKDTQTCLNEMIELAKSKACKLDRLRQEGAYSTCNTCGRLSNENPCPICGREK